jgi:hypothetical protein
VDRELSHSFEGFFMLYYLTLLLLDFSMGAVFYPIWLKCTCSSLINFAFFDHIVTVSN